MALNARGKSRPIPPAHIPRLAGPVGAANPRFPDMNRAGDLRLVDQQLALIAELRNPAAGDGGVTPIELQMAKAVADYRHNRAGAIGGFQRTAMVGTPEERQFHIIMPDGATWPALVTYGKLAEELDASRDLPRNAKDYVHTGRFDREVFKARATAALNANAHTKGKFYKSSLDNYIRMLTFMELDSRIIDVRWMAYMMATAFLEAAEKFVAGHRKNGKKITHWRTMVPINEGGLGVDRKYGRPVKVEKLSPTKAKITEWDGDEFEMNGASDKKLAGKGMGAAYSAPSAKAYGSAKGTEHAYFGRGYVQLTWWKNYAAAGVAIGRGHDLLHNPDLALDPDIAYKVLADGMMTGRHYANGRRIQNYCHGTTTDYAGARAIVNAGQIKSKKKEEIEARETIIAAAQIFERALLAARI